MKKKQPSEDENRIIADQQLELNKEQEEWCSGKGGKTKDGRCMCGNKKITYEYQKCENGKIVNKNK